MQKKKARAQPGRPAGTDAGSLEDSNELLIQTG
jgi:hypothetical protein